MLQLTKENIIGEGVDRQVYAHPEDPELCVKIAKHDFTKDFKAEGPRDYLYLALRQFKKEYFNFNFTDVLYATKLKNRGDESVIFKHLPLCYGYVETNLGKGVVWQRIHNYDGSACITLKDCFLTPGLLGNNEKELLQSALDEFYSWQMEHSIMLREMALINTMICRVSPTKIRLYHIDAIGCVDLIPLADYAKWFAKMRIWSKVRRFRQKLTQLFDKYEN